MTLGITCPICKSSYPDGLPYIYQMWRIVRCPECGHAFVPTGDSRELEQNTHFEESGYVHWREGFTQFLQSIANKRVKFVLSNIEKQKGKVLEIGCSTGEMLGAMAAKGWQAFGVDLSALAIEESHKKYKDIETLVGTEAALFEQNKQNQFDLIIAFHVVEHIQDVDTLLENCRKLLVPGGCIVVFVPHWQAWSRFVLGNYWPDFLPEHIHFFSQQSMTTLLERHSFDLVYAATGGSSWTWLGGILRRVRGLPEYNKVSEPGSGRKMPGRVKLKILTIGDVVLSPLLLLERLFMGGSELRIIAQDRIETFPVVEHG